MTRLILEDQSNPVNDYSVRAIASRATIILMTGRFIGSAMTQDLIPEPKVDSRYRLRENLRHVQPFLATLAD
jgi:hypothetical protein